MSFDDVFSKAAGGAGLGASIGGPWGALIGAGGGLLYGLLGGGGGGQEKPLPSGYTPDAAAFGSQASDPYNYMGLGGQGNYYGTQYQYATQEGVPVHLSQRQNAWADESARERDALGWLSQMARGDDSIARREGALQQQALAADIQSQAAMASQGRYNPALQRQAMLQRSQLGQQMAGQTALNAAQEQLAARNAYAQAVGQQQQNRALWNQVATQAYGAQTNRMGTMNQMRAGWMQMALDQAERDRVARMQLEAMRMQAGEGQANREFQQYMAQQEAARTQQHQQNMGWLGMGQAGLADWARQRGGAATPHRPVEHKIAAQGGDDADSANRDW